VKFWRQVLTVLGRDLVVERRASEALTVTLPFGVVALMAVPLAVGLDLPLISRIGMLALLGVDPAARLIGRALSAGILLAVYMTITAIATVLLYSPEPVSGWPRLIPLGLLYAAGLALLTAMAGEVTAGLGSRSALAPLLVAPLAVPLLIAASQAQESMARGKGILIWTLLMVAADLVLVIIGVLVARPLEEAGR
jgi:heme exporter protein B